ncbi:MAG: YtxH domain-containing protein [Bacteroidetes bacterium]|nr:YtxH domain-containing protein [Bacteroidota bacterium]MBK7388098.1 YtxH domain-containing protein [Bacteroidota bacterium]MBK8413569.1 YtxH domain-containing protein [Bacteroidota bacterium]MBK8876863.1 YtxH domain-containing protein [Bacteroidota bacterium]MBK9046455.1 YtxH domain-containing protein [Bacteroidota bacterium]
MGNNSKILLALLAGAAAGVAIGILIAPEKGSESRKKITDTAKKLADTLLTKAEETLDEMAGKTKV